VTSEVILTHERSGEQIRSSLSPSVLAAIAAAGLKPAERALVLEHVQTAIVAERRGEQCSGAAYLTRAASDVDTPARIGVVLRQVATGFVRPKR
jgi:hypothetical protein